jgi:hypothetical protein
MDEIEGADPDWANTPEGTERILAMAHALRKRVDSHSRLAREKTARWLSAAEGAAKSAEAKSTRDGSEPDAGKLAKSFEDLKERAEANATIGEFKLYLAKANALLATAMCRRMNADEEGARPYRSACKSALASAATLTLVGTTCRRVFGDLHQLDRQDNYEIEQKLKYARECASEIGFWAWRFRR